MWSQAKTAEIFHVANLLSGLALRSLVRRDAPVIHLQRVMNAATAQERLTANINELLAFTHRRQSALAAHLKVSQPHISNLLGGKRQWQIEDLDRIADFFCVTVADLFYDGHGQFDRRRGGERRSGLDRRRQRPERHREDSVTLRELDRAADEGREV